ncbi:MAG: VOC family protein, partial [Terracidiphilus sp.]
HGTVLGWEVGDVKAVVLWLERRGVSTEKYPFVADKELGIWESPTGDQVAWFRDPDGNVLSVNSTARK